MDINTGESILKVLGLGALAFVTTKWLSVRSEEEWEFTEEKEETVKLPVEYGVSIDVYKGIGDSKGKWSADWRRQDGERGRVFADSKSQVVSKAKKEAEKD